MPAAGLSFGASVYPQAIIDQPAQFDFYDGGGLDFAALGAAQIDAEGNVNVSKFGDPIAGRGRICQHHADGQTLVFCGTFTAGGTGGGSRATEDSGSSGKDPPASSSSGSNRFRSAAPVPAAGRKVLYVTERAVFRLTAEGLELIEVAPGIDLKQVLDLMDFQPIIRDVRPMPAHCFR